MIIPLTSAAAIALVPAAAESRSEAAVVYQVVPASAITFTATPDGLAGQVYVFKFVTSGVSSFVLTFGTGFLANSTLATGTTTAKTFLVVFVSDGNLLIEASRTTAL